MKVLRKCVVLYYLDIQFQVFQTHYTLDSFQEVSNLQFLAVEDFCLGQELEIVLCFKLKKVGNAI